MTYYPPAPVIRTELGKERLCRGCGEFWPTDDGSGIDPAFWYYQKDRKGKMRIMGRCRACWSERGSVNGVKSAHRPMAVTV